ncbi:hypothetical protein C8Q75DRAFT_804955 [Abortiporus biennis]|nr:hypothetical protein C8Q75DRAFT_804955 [Abortiporus biennis]
MPFERYFNTDQHEDSTNYSQRDSFPEEYRSDYSQLSGSPTFSTNVQFQMPQLMLGPTLAPGGGAEVLPAGMLANTNAFGSGWFNQLGFPRFTNDSSDYPPSQSPPPPSPLFAQPISQSLRKSAALVAPSPSYPHPSFASYVVPQPTAPSPTSPLHNLPLSIPSSLGLPVYSQSGFDLLSILARVATRPHPKIILGPVDMSCSFCVVDKRRFDNPIVYCSPTFCKLTGYSEHEVLGMNCRFLQAPDGRVQKGEPRKFTAPDAVALLRNSLMADKECQTSMINYRKGGAAFINLITVIPILGGVNNAPEEADDVVYHVGFQIDLTEQPNAILQRLRDGNYIVNYSTSNLGMFPTTGPITRDWRANSQIMSGASKEIRYLLTSTPFLQSLRPTTITTTLPSSNEKGDQYDGNKLLNLILLEASPDFVHVVSLKGAFLYVAPTVRRVLGYEPEDLVGKTIAEFCHPADVVPLMRELKESSTISHEPHTPTGGTNSNTGSSSSHGPYPKTVDLLFRMKAKSQSFIWLECRGRLHIEPGKGRKAIILSGRVRSLPTLEWGSILRAAPQSPSSSQPLQLQQRRSEDDSEEREFWGLLSTSGTFLFVGTAIKSVLGWGAGEVIGRPLNDLVYDPPPPSSPSSSPTVESHSEAKRIVEDTLNAVFTDSRLETRTLACSLNRKDGSTPVYVRITFFNPSDGISPSSSTASFSAPTSRPLVCHIRSLSPSDSSSSSSPLAPPHTKNYPSSRNVFEELNVEKASSWQYELQQLKIANQRLMEELEALESNLGSSSSSSSAVGHEGGEIRGVPSITTETVEVPQLQQQSSFNMIGSGVRSAGGGGGTCMLNGGSSQSQFPASGSSSSLSGLLGNDWPIARLHPVQSIQHPQPQQPTSTLSQVSTQPRHTIPIASLSSLPVPMSMSVPIKRSWDGSSVPSVSVSNSSAAHYTMQRHPHPHSYPQPNPHGSGGSIT